GLDVVQTVDAGDAVTDREHLTDLGDLCLLAEILDLVLKDCGDFRGADVHQPTSFSASLSELSFVLSDVSIWREPILTISPPSSDGSTPALIATSLPVTPFSVALSSCSCAGVSGCAEVTSAATSPRASAAMARNALIMEGTAKRRRFCATTRRKLPTRPVIPALSAMAATALNCSSAEKTGLLIMRERSSLSASSVSKP